MRVCVCLCAVGVMQTVVQDSVVFKPLNEGFDRIRRFMCVHSHPLQRMLYILLKHCSFSFHHPLWLLPTEDKEVAFLPYLPAHPLKCMSYVLQKRCSFSFHFTLLAASHRGRGGGPHGQEVVARIGAHHFLFHSSALHTATDRLIDYLSNPGSKRWPPDRLIDYIFNPRPRRGPLWPGGCGQDWSTSLPLPPNALHTATGVPPDRCVDLFLVSGSREWSTSLPLPSHLTPHCHECLILSLLIYCGCIYVYIL